MVYKLEKKKSKTSEVETQIHGFMPHLAGKLQKQVLQNSGLFTTIAALSALGEPVIDSHFRLTKGSTRLNQERISDPTGCIRILNCHV